MLLLLVNQIVMKIYSPKKNYETRHKFQDNWATKLPRAKMNVHDNGLIHVVKCCNYLMIDRCNNRSLFPSRIHSPSTLEGTK